MTQFAKPALIIAGKLEEPMRQRGTVDTLCVWSSQGFPRAVRYWRSDHSLAQNHLAAWLDVCSMVVVFVGERLYQ